MKSVKQGLARTAARAQRSLETGDLFVLAGLVTREGPVCICPTGYSGERCEEGLLLTKSP